MRMSEIIDKKRRGLSLDKEEIYFWIKGLTRNEIPDYQTSALAMAICLNGMNKEETYHLTGAMTKSGDVVDLSTIRGIKVDKHSTGGVGDKTSIVLIPMVAACGIKVAKMSGRGLGHTGGTLDKLEAIPGFNIALSEDEFIDQVNDIGLAIIGQTTAVAPADKKLYALRDVTATVESIPLIASSIMSKKLASGSDAITLDVTVGSGAFMKSQKDALALAKLMSKIGKYHKKDTRAVISNMNQPLGYAVGNALEIKEAIEALKGQGPEDLMELCYTLGSIMLVQAGIHRNERVARRHLEAVIRTGAAYEKFKKMVQAQGGNTMYIDQPTRFRKVKHSFDILSNTAGYIKDIDAYKIGLASMELGAGRVVITDKIDPNAGIYLYKKVGDYVNRDDRLMTIYTNNDKYEQVIADLMKAYTFSKDKVAKPKVIIKVLTK